MFNSGIRGKRAKDSEGIVNPQSKFIQTVSPQPSISSYTISGLDDTALDVNGGQTIIVTGAGFATGVSASLGGTQIGAVSLINSTQLSFTSPAKSAGTYSLVVYNSNGAAAILVPGISYSSIPTFNTAAGSIGSVYETASISTSVSASSDSSVTYSLDSGSLPPGASLSSNGTITGTAPADSGSTTYTFSIKATDTELQDVTRTFTLTVNTDIVTWVTPPSGSTILLNGTAYSQALSATDAAGKTVSYAANALPAGLTLSSSTISGTPTAAGSVTTLLTATATTNRSATNTITWIVTLGDSFWKYTSLLLNGVTPTTTFINDASLNNAQLVIAGDTKPNNFNPYTQGYYSNYFDGTGDFMGVTLGSPAPHVIDSGESFTVEAWVYPTASEASHIFAYGCYKTAYSADIGIQLKRTGGTLVVTSTGGGGTAYTANFPATIPLNTWSHLALVRKADGTFTAYLNGVGGTPISAIGAIAPYTNRGDLAGPMGFWVGINEFNWTQTGNQVTYAGYISNVNFVKAELYTANFTPPTTPPTSTTNTLFLGCQSNRMLDNSNYNRVLTKSGDTTISPAHPFSTPTTVSYNNLYSTYFDGTGDYLSIATNTALNFGAGDFTIESWVYPVSLAADFFLISASGSGGLFFGYNSTVGGFGWGRTGVAWDYQPVTTKAANTWQHVAVSRQGASMKLFVNGVQQGTTQTISTAYDLSTTSTTIGSQGTAYYLNGNISNLRVVKGSAVYTGGFTPSTTPLTAVAGTSLLTCQSQTLKDNSSSSLTITSAGQAQPIVSSPFSPASSSSSVAALGSVYFDGTGDYLTIPYSPNYSPPSSTTAWTIEFWFYCTSSVAGNQGLFRIGNGAIVAIAVVVGSGSLYVDMSTNGSTWGWSSGAKAMTLNQWNHFALVRNGSTTTAYLNGVSYYSASSITLYNNSSPLYLGYDGGNSPYYLNGYLADVRVVNGTALYTANFTPPQTLLTPIANTHLLTCQYKGGANNNGIVDNSSFSIPITRTGNVAQGSLTPYSTTGWSTYFTGNEYLSTTSAMNTVMGGGFATNIITIECWVFPTSWTAANSYYTTIIGSYAAVAANGRWYFGLTGGATSSGNLKFAYTTGTGAQNDLQSTTTLPYLNTWTHIAVTIDATTAATSTIKFFANGVLTDTFTNQNMSTQTSYYSAANIGGNMYLNQYIGFLSNLRIQRGTLGYTGSYTVATSPLDPTANTVFLGFQSNRLVDNSASSIPLTVASANAPTIQSFSPFNGMRESTPNSYGVYFPANGSYISGSNANFNVTLTTTAWTFEAWVFPITSGNIFAIGNGSPYGNAIAIDWGRTIANKFNISQGNGSGANPVNLATTNTYAAGVWYHLAVTRTSAGVITVFVNGTSAGTVTYNAAAVASATTVVVNGLYDNNGLGNGGGSFSITNLRYLVGTALYTSNFTAPTTILTAIANTQLLICQSSVIKDNSTNAMAVTSSTSAKVINATPFGFTTASAGGYVPSVNGGSVYFDGSGDSLTSPGSTAFTMGSTAFTVEYWVYQTTNTGTYTQHCGSATTSSGFAFGVGTLALYMTTSTTGYTATGSIVLSSWQHIAWTRDSSGFVRGFLNGVLCYGPTSITTAITETNFGIGQAASGTAYAFTGYIADLKVTKGTALYTSGFVPPAVSQNATSSTALLLNFTGAGIIDQHSTSDLETVGNTQLGVEDPYQGNYYSALFNGSSSIITVAPGTFGSADFTIEFWLYSTVDTSQVFFQNFRWYNGLTPGSMSIYYNASQFGINLYTGGGSAYDGAPGASPLSATQPSIAGRWVHIAAGRNGANAFISVNGVYTSSALSSNTALNLESRTTYGIGGYNDNQGGPGWWLNGYMSNFRIVKNTALYTTNFTPPTNPLSTVSGIGLLTFNSNKIKDESSNNLTLTNTAVSVKTMNPFKKNSGISVYFDGTGDYLQLASNPQLILGQGSATIEFWIYPISVSGYQRIVTATIGGFAAGAFCIRFNNGTMFAGDSGANAITTSGMPILANQWNHVAWVGVSGTSQTLYVNGVSVGTSTTYNLTTAIQWIGGYYTTGPAEYTNAYIKDLRITKGIARYTATFTPPTDILPSK